MTCLLIGCDRKSWTIVPHTRTHSAIKASLFWWILCSYKCQVTINSDFWGWSSVVWQIKWCFLMTSFTVWGFLFFLPSYPGGGPCMSESLGLSLLTAVVIGVCRLLCVCFTSPAELSCNIQDMQIPGGASHRPTFRPALGWRTGWVWRCKIWM